MRRLKEMQEEDRRKKLEELKQHVSQSNILVAPAPANDCFCFCCRPCTLSGSENSRTRRDDVT